MRGRFCSQPASAAAPATPSPAAAFAAAGEAGRNPRAARSLRAPGGTSNTPALRLSRDQVTHLKAESGPVPREAGPARAGRRIRVHDRFDPADGAAPEQVRGAQVQIPGPARRHPVLSRPPAAFQPAFRPGRPASGQDRSPRRPPASVSPQAAACKRTAARQDRPAGRAHAPAAWRARQVTRPAVTSHWRSVARDGLRVGRSGGRPGYRPGSDRARPAAGARPGA